jgi:hypothetical protein
LEVSQQSPTEEKGRELEYIEEVEVMHAFRDYSAQDDVNTNSKAW